MSLESEEAAGEFGVRPMGPIRPESANLEIASVKRFLKLAERHSLIVRVQAHRLYVLPTYYLAKSKAHNVGDLKSEGKEIEAVFVTITNLHDFGVHARWYGGTFDHAFIGGQRTGHRPKAMFKQITKAIEEIERCLT